MAEHTAIGHRAFCLGKYLGYIRKLLVFVANHNYSSLDGGIESSNILDSSLGLLGLKLVILLSINYSR